MLTVPDHIRLAPFAGLVDGYASTMPPPFFLIEARTALRPNHAMPISSIVLIYEEAGYSPEFLPLVVETQTLVVSC
jgi:hypothetical protein